MKKDKSAQSRADGLPVNRKQVFFRSFRSEYPVILLVSVIMTAFAIPFFAAIMLSLAQLAELSEADLSIAENLTAMYGTRLTMYLWCVPALAVLAVGASGCFYVVRRLVWGQEVKFFRDFGAGVKSNVIQYEIVTLLFSLFAFGLCYGCDLLTLNLDLGGFYPFLLAIQIILLLLALAFLLFQYCEIVVYKSSVFKQIKNSFMLTLGSLPLTLAALIGALAPVLLLLLFAVLQTVPVLVILSTALALVGFGYAILLFTLHCHGVFDRHVNKRDFPEIYRRGLYDAEAAQKQYDEQNKRQY